MKNKILTVLFAISVSLFLGACESKEDKIQEEGDKQEALMETAEEEEESAPEINKETGQKVAVLFAGQEFQMKEEREQLQESLEKEGYVPVFAYGNGNAESQQKQLEKALKGEVQALVISPVAGGEMGQLLEKAKEQGIPVIAYENLLMDTEAVTSYVTFDFYGQGQAMARELIKKAGLEEKEWETAVTIEIFLDSTSNINNRVFYLGLMEELSPYLEEGRLVCLSGRDTFEKAALEVSGQKKIEAACEEVLERFYKEQPLDIVCVSSDMLAKGVCGALERAEYKMKDEEDKEEEKASREEEEKEWPLVCGGHLSLSAENRIRAGKQAFSFYEDRLALAKSCAEAVSHALKEESTKDLSRQYDNGTQIVPAYLTDTSMVDAKEYAESEE